MLSSSSDLSNKKICVYKVFDINWIEGNKTGEAVENSGAAGINFYNRPNISDIFTNGYGENTNIFSAFDVSEYIRETFKNKKTTIGLSSDISNRTTSFTIYSKETSNPTNRPYLQITYYEDDEIKFGSPDVSKTAEEIQAEIAAMQ